MTALLAATAGRLTPLPRRAGRLAARVPMKAWLILLLALAALGGGWLWLRDSSLVAVRQVQVIGASGNQARQVREALRTAAESQTTLHVDVKALRTAVSPYPIVHDVRVVAHPPHRLTITVVAERPAALLTVAGQRIPVSASGKVLAGSFAQLGLPRVVVATPPTAGQVTARRALGAIDVVADAPGPLRARVVGAAWTAGRGLVVTLRSGPLLIFGDATRVQAKWLATARVLADRTSKGATYLDVRVPERPAAGGVGPTSQEQAGGTPAAPGTTAPATALTPTYTAPTTPSATAPTTPVTPTQTTPSTTAPSTGTPTTGTGTTP
ncbi:MAG TPA: FtsQ-type POTRA domain-containing protein [Solirubrobacteraceae bacterium]